GLRRGVCALCPPPPRAPAHPAGEAARATATSPQQRRFRHAALLAERLAEQLRGAVTALRLLEHPPIADATRQVIGAAALFADETANDGPALLRGIDRIQSAFDQIGIADLIPDESTARFSASGPSALTASDDLAVIARLADGGSRYAAAPDLDGSVPETGPWARSRPMASPDNAAARLRARLDELVTMPKSLRGLVTDAAPCPDAPIGYRLAANLGAAAVETARRRLYHLVELDRDGRVGRFSCLAPTEWNFHPRGPLARMLRGATLQCSDRQAVDQLIAAFDPCVGYRLTLRETADA
ncbi:hydrogenase assembly protein HupF, partial [Rhodopseudomonas sp. BAL398]|uniref:hydrogenase assembly protein HupF n=1 Tax=Rhodopseudomonas sp. BAL398 TaxID=3034676 RepID=UPI0023E3219E